MTARHGLEKRRWSAEPWSTNVVLWLNEGRTDWGRNTPASRRRILDLLQTFHLTLSLIESAGQDADLINRPPKRLSRLLVELNERLLRYETGPTAYIELDGSLAVEDALTGLGPIGENLAAHAVIQLAEKRLLQRVRRCVCGKYFFANFSHQRSCSAACRHKNYEQTEQFKERRRAYMRTYYRLKISGKVK